MNAKDRARTATTYCIHSSKQFSIPEVGTGGKQQQKDFLKKNLHVITKAQKTNITDSAKKCGKLANHKLYDCLLNKFNRSLLSQNITWY